ncbi:MAG: hypothetical protein WEF86_04450 [Gemmatimonadota bacterium]
MREHGRDEDSLGAANKGGRFYFFDSEQGLFEINTANDLALKFFDGYESGKYVQA